MKDNAFKSIFDKDICPQSPNTNGRHEFVKTHTTVDGKTGYYYICKHCGKSAGEVGEEAYQQQVSTLPATGYNSAGRLIWQCSLSDLDLEVSYFILPGAAVGSYPASYLSSLPISVSDMYGFSSNVEWDSNSCCFAVRQSGAASSLSFGFRITYPISGSYRQLGSLFYSYNAITSSGTVVNGTDSYGEASSFGHCNSGSYFDVSKRGFDVVCAPCTLKLQYFYLPVFEIIPDTVIDTTSGGQYSITTRPTTITGGNYGIIGDGNQITTITDNRQIINEGDNIYYNPATGQTQTITDWTYNYDGRIYNITLDTGDKVSVEYGDENITIVENNVVEGDTIVNNYTIYYMIDGSGSGENPDPTPGPTACPHEWYKTGERQATCLIPAQRTYTCSICGEQKTETDPVLGHSWHAIQTVTTQYDENGNLTQEGYTIYECERCGEQYKSTNDTGPPPSGGDSSGEGDDKESVWDKIGNFFGTILEGIIGIFDAILGKLLDALVALSEMLLGKIKDVVEVVLSIFDELPALFDGFLNFLALIFPFLPSEITLLLTFGVIAVVFIGIIKAIRR